MIQYKKILMTLALLLTAVGGAWAQTETLLTTITATGKDSYSETTPGVVTVTHDNDDFSDDYGWLWRFQPGSLIVEAKEGYTITKCVFNQPDKTPVTVSTAPFRVNFIYNGEYDEYICEGTNPDDGIFDGVKSIEVYGYATAPALTVEWNASTKTGTFAMPGGDVVLTPQYAPVATWDVENAGTTEEKVLLPAALEGIIAGTTNAIVTAGQSAQGTVMYAATTTNTEAPALSAFSAELPTAAILTGSVAQEQTVYVWYYIKGQDTPQGQEATEENTFNDSEILGPIAVTLQPNVFDLTFDPAPVVNMTVTTTEGEADPVEATAEQLEAGKLEGIKMGSEVKLKAKQGYKFIKVVAKEEQ